ncbi:putative uncharacterized protein [Moritella viscosa]|nr:integrase [Moritella viscosa]CED61986.1 putative uncharacterized protein [Moritella viscosa]SHO07796.1 Phage integrase family protein [Moritella viscosa]
MFSVSMDVDKFKRYALPQSQFPMPSDATVVSVDKGGNPVSYFGDDTWDFNAFFNNTNESPSAYNMNHNPDKHNPKLLLELKQRLYFLIWGTEGELLHMNGDSFRKFSSCHSVAKTANISLRLFKNTAINSFSLLSNDLVFNQLLHDLKRLNEQTVRFRLNSLSVLTQLNHHFPEHSIFSLGLPEGTSIQKAAKQYSSSSPGHFPTVIPVIYEQLMGRLIQDVTAAHDKLSDLYNIKHYAQKYERTEHNADYDFKTIEGACFMTLSAFSGMRISELTQIDSTSYREVDLDGLTLCTLRSWTSKLELIPREDSWACAPICKKALEVLSVLNDDYRSDKGNIHHSPSFNFEGQCAKGDNISSQKVDAILNKSNLGILLSYYSKVIDITYKPDEMDEVYRLLNPVIASQKKPIRQREDGSFYWHFSSHSLRRTFAHFVVGNGLVTLAALKYQLKHASLAMTAIYASHSDVLTLLGIENPASVKKAIEKAESDNHHTYLKDMMDNPDQQSGGYMKHFEGDPKVLTDKQFEELEKQTKGANKSTGYGRCFAGSKCSMTHLFEPSDCVGRDCENLNINDEESQRWQERHNKVHDRLRKMKDMGFYNKNTLARELVDIRTMEKVMRDHSIEFKRFELGDL